MSHRFLFLSVVLSLFLSITAIAGWETVGGNSMRNGQSDIVGPDSDQLLWEGSEYALFAGQIYIDGDKLVTMRFQSIDYTPIVCHNLYSGEILWEVDFPGENSRSVPRGFRDGKVYAVNFQESQHDTLYALDAEDGSIMWTCEKTVPLGIIWAVVFAPNGDLIIPGSGSTIVRIDHNTGQIVWETPRELPNTGAEGLCVYENSIYGWQGYINTPKTLTAWDLETGDEKYSSESLPGDGDQETTPSISHDGTIFALRDGGNLHALTDTGSGFTELWDISIGPTSTWIQFGVAHDGMLLTPDGNSLVSIDPTNGNIVYRSPDLVSSSTLTPRITIGGDGTIYLINGAASEGAFYALTPDLQISWSLSLPYNYYSGPALGSGGILAISGNGTTLKVFQTEDVICADIDMIPDDYPINVPPGGSFGLTGYLTNPHDGILITDVWVGVAYLGDFFQLRRFPDIPINPGQTLSAHLNQTVPNYAPQGTYQYVAYTGDYQEDFACDSAMFDFTVSGDASSSGHGEWLLKGEWSFGEYSENNSDNVMNYPNPFNAITTIEFMMDNPTTAVVEIYNIKGQKIATPINRSLSAGAHQVSWDASAYSSGVYFYKVKTDGEVYTGRMTILK
ncbi:MAG: PQQ-binding-like beta-propeller repeat protein [candidate division Zixibacteria bacterium]|nr:PQQ-binding-like beta-propeller repeat protein [candidate division Zixibacteria bacterium]